MATHGPSRQGDSLLLTGLLEGQTVADAARAARMSVKTARRRLAEPAFRQALQQARQEALAAAVTRLTAATATASAGLERLAAGAGQESVQLAACRSILELALRGVELIDITERLSALEARVAAAPQNGRTSVLR